VEPFPSVWSAVHEAAAAERPWSKRPRYGRLEKVSASLLGFQWGPRGAVFVDGTLGGKVEVAREDGMKEVPREDSKDEDMEEGFCEELPGVHDRPLEGFYDELSQVEAGSVAGGDDADDSGYVWEDPVADRAEYWEDKMNLRSWKLLSRAPQFREARAKTMSKKPKWTRRKRVCSRSVRVITSLLQSELVRLAKRECRIRRLSPVKVDRYVASSGTTVPENKRLYRTHYLRAPPAQHGFSVAVEKRPVSYPVASTVAPYYPPAHVVPRYEREMGAASAANIDADLMRAIEESSNDMKAVQNAASKKEAALRLLIELQSREITPEDYELLMVLDETVEKAATPSSVVEQLPTMPYKEVAQRQGKPSANEENLCLICYCEYELEEIVCTLPCSHIYHAPCIHRWLTEKSTTCPLDGLSVECA